MLQWIWSFGHGLIEIVHEVATTFLPPLF